MRQAMMTVLLFSSLCAVAKDREWKDAMFLGISSVNAGTIAVPVGTSAVAAPLTRRFYIVKMEHVTYYLQTSYTGRWPNLTVNAPVKFSVDGRTAHLLDEDNKDRKFSIVEKVADKN